MSHETHPETNRSTEQIIDLLPNKSEILSDVSDFYSFFGADPFEIVDCGYSFINLKHRRHAYKEHTKQSGQTTPITVTSFEGIKVDKTPIPPQTSKTRLSPANPENSSIKQNTSIPDFSSKTSNSTQNQNQNSIFDLLNDQVAKMNSNSTSKAPLNEMLVPLPQKLAPIDWDLLEKNSKSTIKSDTENHKKCFKIRFGLSSRKKQNVIKILKSRVNLDTPLTEDIETIKADENECKSPKKQALAGELGDQGRMNKNEKPAEPAAAPSNSKHRRAKREQAHTKAEF
ncbi:hypothetical protein AYI69_g8071 [Smittium culicis]|uniref:Uncharacterized protein n=1 Tax=Smittium culicis TaxID=133412 RepID=A0A1R1XMD7_9FUNG|nr:hypothetical protein AYI69_g8071 [Smittium culicis]